MTDLAPSHCSFSGLEPDENRDILYPRWELIFSTNRGKVEQSWVSKRDGRTDGPSITAASGSSKPVKYQKSDA